MGDPSLHKSENGTILDPSGRVRLGLSFTTAGSCNKAWPIGVVEKTRSDTRPHGLPVGGGTGVAAHPVAQLTEQVTLARSLQQTSHRPRHSRTRTFHTIYDMENHQTEFFGEGNSTSTPDATYHYDGDGRRVKKVAGSEVTIFVYDASGKLVAEYATTIAPVETAQVSYLTQDHLGSPRVVSDKNGAVLDRKDFSAFGEESTSAQRTSNGEYTAADQLRQNYTGYEKDSESKLEFAQARYYNPTHGRFTSVDPLTASATIRNPQTFNRYSYVLNSPYKFSDPLGLIPETTGACGTRCPNSGGYVDGSAIRGEDGSFGANLIKRIYQREITIYTVVHSEADGRQATITITKVVDRILDEQTGRVLESANPQVTAI